MEDDASNSLKLWVTFAGGVLVIVVLYWAQAVLVPVALAVLLSFVLASPVNWLERWVGRVPAVLMVVTLVFVVLGFVGWGLTRQMDNLVEDLPRYRTNIRAKIADVRGAGKGGAVEKLQETLEGIKTDLEKTDAPQGRPPQNVVLATQPVESFPALGWLRPPLRDAGATLVATTLAETRTYLSGLVEIPRIPAPEADGRPQVTT